METVQEYRKQELLRLLQWISNNADDWKLICNPDHDSRDNIFKYGLLLERLNKESFDMIALTLLSKSYYHEGMSNEVENVLLSRVIETWDDDTLTQLINKVTNKGRKNKRNKL